MKKVAGFTLVELIVSISIIAVLSTIGMAVFTNIAKNNRDQQRLRNLHTVKQALELYRNDLSYYPLESAFVLQTASQLVSPDDSTKVYLNTIPTDPISGRYYNYMAFDGSGARCSMVGQKCARFALCAKQEGSGVLPASNDCAFATPVANCGTSLVCDSGVASD